MNLELPLVVGGLAVGIIVGLTGMCGGALMTPMLVFFAGIDPLTAISSDVVVSLFMKPAAAAVHVRRGTVHLGLSRPLRTPNVPAIPGPGGIVGAEVTPRDVTPRDAPLA
jgi:uncharacterized membrane protein YfcA